MTAPTAVPAASRAPSLVSRLLDDAAIFPPGNVPVPEAWARHAQHLRAPHAPLVGPFLCSEVRWPELAAVVEQDVEPAAVALVVTGGAPALASAVRAAVDTTGVRLVSVELATSGAAADPRDVGRTLAALEATLPHGVAGFVEVPPGADLRALLDRLAGSPYRAKLRTGGTAAAAFPDERSLAEWLGACLARDVPLKLTAGLHNAIRHRDPVTGFEHHGFLNVVLAVAAGRAGGSVHDLAGLLAERDPEAVRNAVARLTAEQVDGVRRSFLSFGTCSIGEPVADLVSLRLLTLEDAP